MKRFLGFLLLLFVLFLLGSLFMPTRLNIKRDILIDNNYSVVYSKVESIAVFESWLEDVRGKRVSLKKDAIFWEEQGRPYSYKIVERKPKKEVVSITQDIKSKQNFIGRFYLKQIAEKQTKLVLEVVSEPTLNPILRYIYGLDKAKLGQILEEALVFRKEVSEAVDYERFHLSSPRVISKNDTVFSIPKETTVATLSQRKKERIDSLLLNRLYRYKMLDTLRNHYLQYADWSENKVAYNVCIPLVKFPTKKQALWLRKGRVTFVKGQFYTSMFRGVPEDLPLAWDSLYVELAKSNKVAEGLPLEQFIEKTDSTETHQLFIRLR